jgi:predicted Zn-ribbon and HTH transcriptional regulator
MAYGVCCIGEATRLSDSGIGRRAGETRLFEKSRGPGWDVFLLSFKFYLGRLFMSTSCPACRSTRIHRSKTRGYFEGFVAKLSIRPYRCDDCDRRFFRRAAKRTSRPGPLAKAT